MAVLTYILCLFTGFIGPLIIWLMKKGSERLRQQTKARRC